MNIWHSTKWKNYYHKHDKCLHRTGLRTLYDCDVNPEVKRACKEFIVWLRTQYYFPKRVRLYVKSSRRIRCRLGSDLVCGTFFRPGDRDVEPYIRIATGDYDELLNNRGQDNALADILWSIAHELTHYFQWVNDIKLTPVGEERQATIYANRILDDYASTRDHP